MPPLTDLATSLTYDLLKSGYAYLSSKLIGSQEQRALQDVWYTAFISMLEILAETHDNASLKKIAAALEAFTQDEGTAELLLEQTLEFEPLDPYLLRERFQRLFPDLQLDFDFNQAIRLLSDSVLPALEEQARQKDSPLAPHLTSAYHRRELKELASLQTKSDQILESINHIQQGRFSDQDLALLRQAIDSRQLILPTEPSVSVGGSVQGNIVIGDRNFVVTLTPEALKLLLPKQYTPLPLPPLSDPPPLPGPLPPGSRLPFPRNALFTGREDELRSLAKTLFYDHNPAAISQPAGLTGMGGLGKTQLAVELAYRYGRCLHGVHWIAADQNIAAEIAACGAAMNLSPWSDKLPEQLSLTLQAWRRQPLRLLIFDNLAAPDVLQDWLPHLADLPLLVTSRCTAWPPDLGLYILPLPTLPRPESLALLRKLAPRLGRTPDSELDSLADRLGDLPLALDLAGRYLADRPRLTVASYLAELDQAGIALQHSSLKDWTVHNPTKHDTNLARTFLLSWQRLAGEGQLETTARRLFCACGYCAPNTPIPWEVLETVLDLPENDRSLFEGALNRLSSLGLLDLSDLGPLLHPLLAGFARLQDSTSPASALPALVDTLASESKRADDLGVVSGFLPLLPHLRQAADHCLKPFPQQAALMYSWLGSLLQAMGDYPAARPYYQQALAIYREVLGENHPDTATSLNNLGYVLKDMGDYPAARPYYEQALAIQVEVLGEKHPATATSLNNLGGLLQDMGDYPAARPYYEQALAIDREVLGDNHPNTAVDLNNLGALLQDMGDYPAARTYFEQALAIDREILGEKHPSLATSLNNLGMLLQAMGDYPAARPYIEQALAIDREILGDNHPDTAIDLNNLGMLLQAMGDYPAARPYIEQALAVFESTLPPNHPYIRTVRGNLASLD